jgi:hypothetical protein
VLLDYFRELFALNAFAMAQAHAAKLDLDDLRARRSSIRERCCTKRRRKTDNVVAYGPLDAKAYDPANIAIEGEARPSKTRALITVRNSALGERWRYLLVLRDGRWLIDSLQMRDRQKWAPVPLH